MSGRVELLSPAGDFDTALAAFAAGADAVYCGLADFSARAFAKNFGFEELARLVAWAHSRPDRPRQVYVTFNTVLDESAIETAIADLARLEEIGPDGVIVQDLGVARICRRHFPGLTLHASTQLVAHNLEGVLALGELGFKRVVLARELSADEIASITKRCGGIELECFIHGALCYSISGLCLFSAMEKGRSGNRGQCAYCCRLAYDDGRGGKTLAFSMKDLRVGPDVKKLVAAGVISLKIEGRMKSPLYVASVTRYYRQLLDGTAAAKDAVTTADLETVFARRTTPLYLNGRRDDVIDGESLGHLGAEIGVVKRVTRDREGRAWLRFHTERALEKHDGLQFEAMRDGRHLGLGVDELRLSISRHPVFEAPAGADVEVRLPEDERELATALRPGDKIYCSMSNAVKRRFPVPAFRSSDAHGTRRVDVAVTIAAHGLSAVAKCGELEVAAAVPGEFAAAKNPEKTRDAVAKAFSKLGETVYCPGELAVNDADRLYAPMSLLNDLRRDLVEQLDAALDGLRRRKTEAALADVPDLPPREIAAVKRLRIRPNQTVPPGDWAEVVVAVVAADDPELVEAISERAPCDVRIAMPVYTSEPEFNRLRVAVKGYLRRGFTAFEASDLATLRMLKALGVTDVTADWTLYAFNSRALAELSDLGVRRFVASPENCRENLQYLAESGYEVEMLAQQSTPLFVSLHRPADQTELAVYRRGEIWVTTKKVPRTFPTVGGAPVRTDLSWDPE